jgi:hypothetical protein
MSSIFYFALLRMRDKLRSTMELLGYRFRNRRGPGLSRSQRHFLLRMFRDELARQVEDARTRLISDQAARRLSLHRSLVRWLERGEFPGAEAVGLFERMLSEIPRNPSGSELAEHRALVAAIHDLGGDAKTAEEIWQEADPELAAGIGRNLHRLMEEADVSIIELSYRSGIPVDAVIAYAYGVEEPGVRDLLELAHAVGAPGPGALLAGLDSICRVDPGARDSQGGDRK